MVLRIRRLPPSLLVFEVARLVKLPETPTNVRSYIKEVATVIREREANMLRGKPDLLERLDHQSDVELVTRWSWTSAIIGAIAVFLIAPFALGMLQRFLPEIMATFFWVVVKVGMGCVVLMFAAAAWLTFNPPGEV